MDDSDVQRAEVLTILGYDDDSDMERGVFDRRLVRDVVDVKKLEEEVRSFLGAMERIIGNLSEQIGNYGIDTITVSAEVNAKGKVSLLGSGGELGGKGGISFTFKRSKVP